MSQVHYDRLLGPLYSWMLGDWAAAVGKALQDFQRWQIGSWLPGRAVDLGCGPGVHAQALASLGFEVMAVDNCQYLLDELQSRATSGAIQVTRADISRFCLDPSASARLVLCLGDTLPHLADFAAVESVLENSARALQPGGALIVTFRDYVSAAPGTQKFIPVRSDSNKILTCHLAYRTDHVTVTDLVHQWSNGEWTLVTSHYEKLRLNPDWVQSTMEACGFETRPVESVGGWLEVQGRLRA